MITLRFIGPKKAKCALPQLFVKSHHSIFESTLSDKEIIFFHTTNKHKHAILTESQSVKHFPSFHQEASLNNLIPVLSLHYVWNDSSEWLLIPKNFEGYTSLLRFSSGQKIELLEWEEIIKIFLFGNSLDNPWNHQDFYISNSSCDKGVFVRENLFLNQADYSSFALITALKNQSSYNQELKLNFHHQKSYLLQQDTQEQTCIVNLINILKVCKKYSLNQFELLNNSDDEQIKRKKIISYCDEKLTQYVKNMQKTIKEQYFERLKREIDMFDTKKYWNYLFIFYELIQYIFDSKILTSAGRGSACSSLLIFLLGITQIDPLKYDLLFDRFLNESSARVPDLDLDVESLRKDNILCFLASRFGPDSFVIPSIIKKVKNLSIIDTLLKKILTDEELKNKSLTSKLLGAPFLFQPHPSSLIPLPEGMELNFLNAQKKSDLLFPVTPFEYGIISYLGLQKFDILSSPYLDFVSSIIKKIKLEKEQEIDLKIIPLDDIKTFRMIGLSLTTNLFHLDSLPIKKVLTYFKPTSISELAQLISIIRPGINKHISQFLNYKFNQDKCKFPEEIEVIISETRGIVLYQEQIMKIISFFSGIPLFKTDQYRVALQKKNLPKLEKLKLEFFKHSSLKKREDSLTQKVWNFVLSFGEYSFNKSHAIAYALSSYQAAYLKANFSAIFYTEAIVREGISDKILSEIISLGFKLSLPKFSDRWSLEGYFDERKKIFSLGFNLLKVNSEEIFKKLQKIRQSIQNQKEKNLKNLIFELLSNGITKEEIMSLNYLNWFREFLQKGQDAIYLRDNWEFIVNDLIFGAVAQSSEKKIFSMTEQESFHREQEEKLNIQISKYSWI